MPVVEPGGPVGPGGPGSPPEPGGPGAPGAPGAIYWPPNMVRSRRSSSNSLGSRPLNDIYNSLPFISSHSPCLIIYMHERYILYTSCKSSTAPLFFLVIMIWLYSTHLRRN